jgi:hypothetical protein
LSVIHCASAVTATSVTAPATMSILGRCVIGGI